MAENSATESQFGLLTQRRFLPFFCTQFLGAFNDNVLKQALLILAAYQGSRIGISNADGFNNLANALFIAPYFILSASAGQLADKYEKSFYIRQVKLLEIFLMVIAALGFYLQNVYLLMLVLMLMGTQSTLFGPVKYSLLPQVLRREELVGGNGLVESGTFLAILLGSMLGGVLIALENGLFWVSVTLIGVAVAGYLSSRAIPTLPANDPSLKIDWHILRATWQALGIIRASRTLRLTVLAISWFWLFGAVYLTQLPNYTRQVLHGGESVVVLLLTLFSVGIGTGSLLCERLSGRKVEIGLVPLGALGLSLFALDIYFAQTRPSAGPLLDMMSFLGQPGSYRVVADLLLMGLFGGFYIVPLYALLQSTAPVHEQARVIAANNIVNALFVVLASALALTVFGLGGDILTLFVTLAVLNVLVSVYIFTVVPEFFLRFVAWLLMHSLYRLRVSGSHHLPETGPGLLVCNHVSYVDALIITAACRRPIRFVMYEGIYRIPILNALFRLMRVIPIIDPRKDRRLVLQAFTQIDQALVAGELVCIFPEGRLSDTGAMHPFKLGVERIVAQRPVPVVPMALRGLWGSFFSRYAGGKALQGWPRKFWARIELVIGEPQPGQQTSATALQTQVAQLRGEVC